jgi:phosphoinositide-3-kinase regulatory subunit 4
MIQSMTESEEFVVEKVIRSLAAMADLGLFQRSTTWDLLHITIGFLVHPNIWIREATVSLVVKSTKFLSVADTFSILTPLIRPYLKVKTVGFSEAELLDALKRPMSRNIYEIVFLWASKTDKGIFWKSASRDAFSLSEPGSHSSRVGRSASLSMSSQSKNEEDEQWLSRLRNLGMTVEDEFKILALRDYICRVSLRQSRDVEAETTLPLGEIISLSQQGVTPQTVFFDKNLNEKSRNTSLERNTSRTRNPLDDPRPRTIADALLDASTTIERSPSAHRKHIRTRSQLHKEIEIPHPRNIAVESSSSSPATSSPAAAPGSRPMSPPGSDVERHTLHANRRLSSGQESSSTTPTNADTLSLRGLPVQRKSSAINLLNRNDTAKAYAETGTSAANAFGKVDAPVQRSGTPQPSALSHAYERKPTQAVAASRRYRANHSYTGDDPVVLRLLDNVFAENYPTDLFDLGPYVKELDSRQPIPKSNSQNVNKLWKPEGNLVATFGEHSGPVNRIAVPPDHSFFVTASDDSTVKIWDTIRLERNLTPRSRQTHRHSPGARVKALTFVENTYTIVSGATDGSIHAVRIDYQKVNENARYGKLQLVREYQLPVAENGLQEYAVWMEHFRDEGQSTLLVATNTCRILALDMKTMLPVFTLENPVHHGTPTTFCCDRRHTWLLIGTTHGVLDLWDLRFRVRLKAWGLPGWGYIHRVQLHPIKSRGRWVCVSSSGSHGNEITVWDIEKFRCREVYQAAPLNSSDTATPNGGATTTHHRSSRGTATHRAHRLSVRDFEAWPVDEDRPEGMLSRFATTSPAAAGIEAGPPVVGNNGSAAAPTNLAGDRMGTLAFIGGLNTPDDDKAASSNSKLGFIVSAGSDRRIRFWDLANPAGSMIVSGLDAVANGTAASKPQYETTQPGPNLSMVIEHMPRSSGDGAAAAGSKKGASPRPPRSTVISLQQQMLLKSHLDIIQDVAVLRQPYGMIVSVDRAGMVYVFK